MPSLKSTGNIPALWTIQDVIGFLSQYPQDARLVFIEPENYAGSLHIVCKEVTVAQYSDHSAGMEPVTYVQLHLKEPFIGTIAKQAGSVSTDAKAKAARENGKKGGRPRKK